MNHEEARYHTVKVERERVTRWGVEALLDVVGRSPFSWSSSLASLVALDLSV
jgi:hypothetical protein